MTDAYTASGSFQDPSCSFRCVRMIVDTEDLEVLRHGCPPSLGAQISKKQTACQANAIAKCRRAHVEQNCALKNRWRRNRRRRYDDIMEVLLSPLEMARAWQTRDAGYDGVF